MNKQINSTVLKLYSIFTLTLFSSGTLAAGLNPVSWDLTLNITTNPGLDSVAVDSILENKLFLDVNYLDKVGGGIGVVRQDVSFDGNGDINNELVHANGWFSWYPSSLGGKFTISLDAFDGSDNAFFITDVTTTTTNPGQGQGQGQTVTTITATVTPESISVINPAFSYLNSSKTFYAELSYAKSDYEAESGSNSLEAEQWSPAVGFGFNENYDWLQLRYYSVDLSNGLRTNGAVDSSAFSASYTHWLEGNAQKGLHFVNLTLLAGDRLYGVEQDVRKIFNVTDQQTGSMIVGGNIKFSSSADMSIYVGFEQYEDLSNELDYDNTFVDITFGIHW